MAESTDPTPEEIKEECEKTRESWSEHEHWQRLGYPDGKPPLEAATAKDHTRI